MLDLFPPLAGWLNWPILVGLPLAANFNLFPRYVHWLGPGKRKSGTELFELFWGGVGAEEIELGGGVFGGADVEADMGFFVA